MSKPESDLDLDLNINNYTISDLQLFFRLDPSSTYSPQQIDSISYTYRETFLKTNVINKVFVRDFILFCNSAKDRLITEINKNSTNNVVTSIYKNPTLKGLDTTNLPHILYPDSSVREQDIISINNSIPIKIKQHLYLPIDSRFRKNPYSVTSSNWSLALPNKLKRIVSLNIASFELSSFNMYNIYQTMGNNYLNITINDTCKYIIIIPDGHYTIASILVAINDELHKDPALLLNYLSVELESHTSNKVIIYSKDDINILSFSLNFALDINGNSDTQHNEYFLKLGRVLGFTRRKYFNEKIVIGETQINPNLCSTYFYISINDYNNNFNSLFVSPFDNINIPSTILSKFSIEHKCDGTFNLTFTKEPRIYHGPVDITNLQIQILDAHGKVIQINNMDYSFTLLFQYMYSTS